MAEIAGAPENQPRQASQRLRLARVAHDAALNVPGVHDTDAGPLGRHATAADGQRLDGIVCAATKDGGYEISVRLIADLVPLPALGERVQTAVRRAASTTGLPLSRVSVQIAGLVADGEAHDAA